MITEAIFQDSIIELARMLGWYVYHPHRSDRSEPGYLDLTMVHPEAKRLLYAEVKSAKGKLTEGRVNKHGRWMPGQIDWYNALLGTGRCEVYVWRVGEIELEEIAEILK